MINWHIIKKKLSAEIFKIFKIRCKVNNHFGFYNPNRDSILFELFNEY
jgi:hypothetical protein